MKPAIEDSTTVTTVTEHHTIVRTRTFNFQHLGLRNTIDSLLLALRTEKATGRFILNLGQGSVGSIQFEESQKLSP